ncbi:MAG: hypothetical protein HFH67_14980 [Lachnospiraceae bacterium]|nr:hypothetical protein [Lachnospiraceae bacterium]
MIMINGNWEQVKDLSDVIKIASENIGDEFGQKIKEIFEENKYKIEELEVDISELRLKGDQLKDLIKQLDILEDYIEKNKDGTDYMRGMEKAYDMIER